MSPRWVRTTAVAVLCIATACGGSDDTSSTATSGASTASTASAGSSETSEPASTPTEAAACRPVTHELGEACVPHDPERIVALDPSTTLPTLLQLDAPVVGAMTAFDGSNLPDYLDPGQLDGIEIVGSAYGVNLEAIAALDPDLIVGWATVMAPIQSELEEIAPTVATSFAIYDPGWRDQALLVADLVDGRAALEADLAAIDDRERALAASLAGQGADVVALHRVLDDIEEIFQ